MIREFVRCYSRQRRFQALGCRVLDYTDPKTHLNIASPAFLSGSRTGNRYANQNQNYDEKLESLTISHMYRQTGKMRSASKLSKQKLMNVYTKLQSDPRIEPENIDMKDLVTSEATMNSSDTWTKILLAPDLESALELASNVTDVPYFVALHTLGRHATSPSVVHNALRHYEQWSPLVPEHVQPELTVLMSKMAQKNLLDAVPSIIQLFIKHTHNYSAEVVNELSWQIARYGKRWSLVDTPLLSQAQEALLNAAGVDHIDTKGLVALAYVQHFRKPNIARQAIVDLADIVASRTPPNSRNDFAYLAGPLIIRSLTSPTVEQALDVADEARTHLPAVWTASTMYLSRNQSLQPAVASKLWDRLLKRISELGKDNLRISGSLTEIIVSAVHTYTDKQKIINEAQKQGLKLTPSLVAKMMKVRTIHDSESAQHTYTGFMNHPLVSEQILQTQTIVEPAKVWSTYCKLNPFAKNEENGSETKSVPPRNALKGSCRSAWDTKSSWDGMYASQRALREIKSHVRGAASPPDDILRLYPNDELLYAYIVMAGRSGYRDELIGFLPWMNSIQHQPSKHVLSALIYYSPQGAALLRMGQKVENWPTLDEFEVYQQLVFKK